MDRFIKSMKAFPFKGMLVIWGIFMLMGAVLFAERSGIHYEGSKSQSAYLSENQIVTEKEAVKELKKTCLVIMDSQQGLRIQTTIPGFDPTAVGNQFYTIGRYYGLFSERCSAYRLPLSAITTPTAMC